MINEFWINYLIQLLGKYIVKIIIDGIFVKIHIIDYRKLALIIKFFKYHTYFKFNSLTEIICVDYLKVRNRFELNYLLLSIHYGIRLSVVFKINEFIPVESIVKKYFNNADWMEREIWDLFGIIFINHPDLRRLLTDYGFSGHPLRKDFPLNGFFEVRYDESKQYIVYEPIEFMQTMRVYNFKNPFFEKYII